MFLCNLLFLSGFEIFFFLSNSISFIHNVIGQTLNFLHLWVVPFGTSAVLKQTIPNTIISCAKHIQQMYSVNFQSAATSFIFFWFIRWYLKRMVPKYCLHMKPDRGNYSLHSIPLCYSVWDGLWIISCFVYFELKSTSGRRHHSSIVFEQRKAVGNYLFGP